MSGRASIGAIARPAGVLALSLLAALARPGLGSIGERPVPPPVNAGFDYQIGGDYPPPPRRLGGIARLVLGPGRRSAGLLDLLRQPFQTQDDEPGVRRRDERSSWPRRLVLSELGDDPEWGGEYLVDISTRAKRRRATAWVRPVVRACAAKGFDAVEYDNLDSWTRFDDTPRERDLPFGKAQAVAYAKRLAARAHALGLAVAQKNTPQLTRRQARARIGFDFAIAEECARYSECYRYRALHGNRVIVIEYRRRDFRRACRRVGSRLSVVLRARNVTRPRSGAYGYDAC